MDTWVKENYGKAVDYDGAYGVQCVDLIKSFIKNVLGIKPQSIGNAIEYYNKRYTSPYLIDNFTWIDYKKGFIPEKGDISVFKTKSGLGHVSVAAGKGNKKSFYSYDQNYPRGKHEPMTLIKHNYNSLLGVLRPKNRANIKLNKPEVKAGKTYTFTTRPYCYKDVTKNNIYSVGELSDFSVSAPARLKKGVKIKAESVLNVKNNIWIMYTCCGKTVYALVYNFKKDKAYIK